MVFDGEEFLEFATKPIRKEVDHISVTYQNTSYFGNKNNSNLEELLTSLKKQGLIDEMILYEPDLTIHHKENELILRNIGLEASKRAGCTHHASLDVDEFLKGEELNCVKKEIDNNDYDFTVIRYSTYYKDPTFLVYPEQDLKVSFIHPVRNSYNRNIPYPIFPYHMETTRKLNLFQTYRVFDKNEITMHHMSYVRKDIRKKFANSDNARFYKLKKFYETFDNYQLGGRVCLLPDYLNRRTIQVENSFGINI